MKHLDTFDNHNESWRQAKAYLKLPHLFIDTAFSKILKYIPRLNFEYDKLAANVDVDNNYGPGTRIGEFEEIKLSDIKDNKIKNSLRVSGLFNGWHIYKLSRLSHDNKTPIYISKDKLTEEDLIYGERIYRDSETEFYVIAAKKTKKHDSIKTERDNRYKKKQYDRYKGLVIDIEKGKRTLDDRTSMGDFTIIFHTLIKNNLTDLVDRAIKTSKDDKELRKILIDKYDNGYQSSIPVSSLELAKDKPEILEILNNTLYDLWLKSKKSRYDN